MENLRRIIGMYFQKVSSYNILHGDISYSNFNKSYFDSISKQVLPCLSDSDTDEFYSYLRQVVDNNETGLNVFYALKLISNEYLMIRDDKPICRYTKILNWRQLAKSVGEDLPICAYLAYRTQKNGYAWKDFEWDTVIGHDNMQLNRIMQRGISDNHFHLFGSAPTFQLIWIKLMNHVDNENYAKSLDDIDEHRLNIREHYATEYKECSFRQMHFQAALIRAILFSYINNIKVQSTEESNDITLKRQKKDINMRNWIIQYQSEIRRILLCDNEIELWRVELQNYINGLRLMMKLWENNGTDDYANLECEARSMNHDFEGERALMYRMLCGEVDGQKIPGGLMDLFYAYLTIQIKFREELVQVNEVIGFENFRRYSRRKGGFLNTSQDNKKMIQHAVSGSFESGNLRSLEIRVTPENTAEKNSSWIKWCDNVIKEYLKKEKENNFYYVFHFPKEKDVELEVKHGIVTTCRHEKLRKKLKKKTYELIEFRERYPNEAERVLGIDACAQEIDCRPEVFASTFRRLTNHVVQDSYFQQVKQWKITYHVGEDGRDFVDGLRAIDEAIRFLDMKNGDRLGHATFLGLDVKKWYEEKRKVIYLPLQDYLDNIVWMYHKLLEFNIKTCETLKGHLLAEYDRCFMQLYGESIREIKFLCGINTYYEAWKHRDVDPDFYRTGEYQERWNPYWGENTAEYVKEEKWFNKKEIVQLLYYYHYSADVRYGRNITERKVLSEIYVDGVEKIQKAMQKFISEKGICIEANPSSNLVISSMKKYEEHPICNLYNLGLTIDAEELTKCAQMHVTINTDDKGIFYTSLENEYALMGRALEKMVDERGNNKYPKQMVYDWLERIRENGNQQSFREMN